MNTEVDFCCSLKSSYTLLSELDWPRIADEQAEVEAERQLLTSGKYSSHVDHCHPNNPEVEQAFRNGFLQSCNEALAAIECDSIDPYDTIATIYDQERIAAKNRKAVLKRLNIGKHYDLFPAGSADEIAEARGRCHGGLAAVHLAEAAERVGAITLADGQDEPTDDQWNESQAKQRKFINDYLPAYRHWVKSVKRWANDHCQEVEVQEFLFEHQPDLQTPTDPIFDIAPWSDAEHWHKIDDVLKLNPTPLPNRPLEQHPEVPMFDPLADEISSSIESTSVSQPKSTNATCELDAEQLQKLQLILKQGLHRLTIGGKSIDVLNYIKSNVGMISTPDVKTFTVISSADLDRADLHTEYLIEGILAAKQPCVFAAGKKCLKTTIGIDATLSLASGAKFLGKFYVPRPVRVALMSGESGDATIQETARRIARSKPWFNLADYENALWGFTLPRLGRPQTKSELIKFVKDNALEVLIIDPAYLCLDLGGDAGNLFEVGPKLFELTEVGQETGCTIIIVHHNRKAPKENAFAPPELESIAWSGFQEWARQWILLGRREPYNPDQGGSHRLWLSVGGSAGHSGLWGLDVEEGSRTDQGGRRWDVSVNGYGSVIEGSIDKIERAKSERETVKKEKQLAADAEKLLKAYAKFPEGETAKTIRVNCGMNPNRFEAVNHWLIEQGQVEVIPSDLKKNGRSYDRYRLVTGTHGNTTELFPSVPVVPVSERATELSPYKGRVPVPSSSPHESNLVQSPDDLEVDFGEVDRLFGGSKT